MEYKLKKNKNFILLFFGQLVSNLGQVFYTFAISWYILDLTGSAGSSGLYLAFGAIVAIIFTPLGGVISDRFNRAKIIYITDYVRGFSILLAGFIIMYNGVINIGSFSLDLSSFSFKLIVLYINSFILSANSALFGPAVSAIIPSIVPDEALQKANASLQTQGSIVNIAGLVLAGALYSLIGVAAIFIINGIAYIGSAISEMFIKIKEEERERTLTLKIAFRDMKEGFNYIVKIKPIFYLILVSIGLNFFIGPLFGLGVPYLYNQLLEVEPIYYSLVGVVFSVGSIVMSVIFMAKEPKEKIFKTVFSSMIFWLAFLCFQAIGVYLVVEEMISFKLFFGIDLFITFMIGVIQIRVNTPVQVVMQKEVEPEYRGRVFSLIQMLSGSLVPIGVALTGIFLESYSIVALYLVAITGFGIATLLGVFSKEIRKL